MRYTLAETVFYMMKFAEMYKTRLKELGGIVPDRVHITRFQRRILSQIPWMSGLNAGKKAALHSM